MASDTPTKGDLLGFNYDETLIITPNPQACSTIDRRLDPLIKTNIDQPELSGFLKDGMETLNQVREKLAKVGMAQIEEAIQQSRESSISSLDLIDLELDDADTSKFLTNLLDDKKSLNPDRATVRERAFKALNLSSAHSPWNPKEVPNIPESNVPFQPEIFQKGKAATSSLNDFQRGSFGMKSENLDESGFSVLTGISQLQRDEEWCNEQWPDLPIKPRDISLLGISDSSLISFQFNTNEDSLMNFLGPADPPKTRDKEITQVVEVCNENHGTSYLLSESNATFDVSVPSISEIAETLRDLPNDATPQTIMDKLIACNDNTENQCRTLPLFDSNKSLDVSIPSITEIAEAFRDLPEDVAPQFIMDKLLAGGSSKSNMMFDSLKKMDTTSATCKISNVSKTEYYDIIIVKGSAADVIIDATGQCEVVSKFHASQILIKIVQDSNLCTKVLLMPFVAGKMNIVLSERDAAMNQINHSITLICEEPKIELLSSPIIDIGTIAEDCIEDRTILLKNLNSTQVCLKHVIKQENVGELCFEMGEPEKPTILAPKEVIQKKIFFHAKPIGEAENYGIKTIKGELQFFMNLPEKLLPPILVVTISLVMNTAKASVKIHSETALSSYYPGETKLVPILNTSCIELNMRAKAEPEDVFSVSPKTFAIPALKTSDILIKYTPRSINFPTEGTLFMQIMPYGHLYNIGLKGDTTSKKLLSSSPTLESADSSRSSILPGDLGALQLQCTQSCLVWPSVNLNSSVEKSCSLRNSSPFREKLLFSIQDSGSSFYFIKEGEKKREIKLSLDPMQKKEITVQMSPTTIGQMRATVVVTRVNRDQEKKTIGLLGFGGRGTLRADGLTMDLETNVRKLVLDFHSLSTSFSLNNTSDGMSYFLISQPCIEGMYLEVSPRFGLLKPGNHESVVLSFKASASNIDYLLKHNKQLEIKVSQMFITYGDQPTRLRLVRLLKKFAKSCTEEKIKPVMKNLAEMECIFPAKHSDLAAISLLKDPLSSLADLYQEGVLQWTVDVVVNRSALEAAQLDSTQQFLLLESSVMGNETMMTSSAGFSNMSQYYGMAMPNKFEEVSSKGRAPSDLKPSSPRNDLSYMISTNK